MISTGDFFIYLAVMAGVTYLIRAVPFVLCKGKIKSKYIRDFLYYVPMAVLGAMTFPDIFYATGNYTSSIAGLIVACVLAFFERSLLTVAVSASGAALAVNLALMIFN
ncbi:MAG: AzlD domain-containing protein [Ruminococcus sp.]|nr:AzlD domain-containing protein [Ruminococcus sp.]